MLGTVKCFVSLHGVTNPLIPTAGVEQSYDVTVRRNRTLYDCVFISDVRVKHL